MFAALDRDLRLARRRGVDPGHRGRDHRGEALTEADRCEPLGVLSSLAVVERLAARGERLQFPIDVCAFSDEESVRYGTTYLGGASNLGLVFKFTSAGGFFNLLSFTGTNVRCQ